MMRKVIACILRFISLPMFVGVPALVILSKFPLWKEQGGTGIAISIELVILIVILLLTTAKYISAFIRKKLGSMSASLSLTILWSVLALVCSLLANITTILNDLSTVFTWSSIGAVSGMALQGLARVIGGKS